MRPQQIVIDTEDLAIARGQLGNAYAAISVALGKDNYLLTKLQARTLQKRLNCRSWSEVISLLNQLT